MAGLLRGVKVIESAMLMTGDFTGQLLADEEADVVKVESPFKGDYLRDFLGQIKPHKKGHSPAHLSVNRNKRSVTLNLKTEEGKAVFWRMLAEADVFVDGNTPGALDRLGVGYDAQAAAKPDIIYAHVTGLGATGPYATVPTHGQSMNALGGAEPCAIDEHGFAMRVNQGGLGASASGVVVGPLYLAYAVAAALYRREKTGQGTYLDVGCSDAIVSHAWYATVRELNKDRIEPENRVGGGMAGTADGSSKYNFYYTKDKKFVLVALIEKHFWENFCRAVGRPDLLEQGIGYHDIDAPVDWGPKELRDELQRIFSERTLAEWMEVARDYDCVISPANLAADLTDDPHLQHREAIVTQDHPTAGPVLVSGHPIKVPGEQYRVYRHAPALGEHTMDYLAGMGYGQDQLDDWKARGII